MLTSPNLMKMIDRLWTKDAQVIEASWRRLLPENRDPSEWFHDLLAEVLVPPVLTVKHLDRMPGNLVLRRERLCHCLRQGVAHALTASDGSASRLPMSGETMGQSGSNTRFNGANFSIAAAI